MHVIKILVAFALAFLFGLAIWFLVNGIEANGAARQQTNMNISVGAMSSAPEPPSPTLAPRCELPPSVEFGPVESISGYSYIEQRELALRESPDEHARVLTTLSLPHHTGATILDATRDFLRVRLMGEVEMENGEGRETVEREGWVRWGEVIPETSAVVLDPETGEVTGRIPLGSETSEVLYSPDGERIIFYNSSASIAYEASARDYALTRTLRPTEGSFSAFFYAAGALHAVIATSEQLRIARIGAGEAATVETVFSAPGTDILISPDSSTGFIMFSQQEGDEAAPAFAVLDLNSLSITRTFTLPGASVSSRSYALSRDGLELYAQLSTGASAVVIDTWTGQQVREFQLSEREDEWTSLDFTTLFSDGIFLTLWRTADEDSATPHAVWITSAGERIPAASDIRFAVEAAGARYALDSEGTQLFRLNSDNRIGERRNIRHPNARLARLMMEETRVFGLAASPDGHRLIMFIGVPHGC